ncbi:hypothetical protein [Bacillus mesophilum]|uniref:Uncharacterized protein n=1 Tax=Bacillus mesophilum TaxID=1071718 RepID=A0A7V7UXE2_9BACI|nr:hypothetical protein [Bacillus mesophilum]KAB2332623.1 hypothetical protein F7732_11055 [Bacillus mesophilum]
MTLGEKNDSTGFSVDFAETVNMKLTGNWSGLLIDTPDRPDPTVAYDDFVFNVDIQLEAENVAIEFGVQRNNGDQLVYKATYITTSQTWSLEEIDFPRI